MFLKKLSRQKLQLFFSKVEIHQKFVPHQWFEIFEKIIFTKISTFFPKVEFHQKFVPHQWFENVLKKPSWQKFQLFFALGRNSSKMCSTSVVWEFLKKSSSQKFQLFFSKGRNSSKICTTSMVLELLTINLNKSFNLFLISKLILQLYRE